MTDTLKKNKINWVLIVLLIINFLATIALSVYIFAQRNIVPEEAVPNKYVMYIGTNDKDTYKQEISAEEAKNIVSQICLKYVPGFTIIDADGAWKDEADNLIHGYTVVCSVNGASKEQMTAAMNDILAELNQSAIMVEEQGIVYYYYGGE